MINNAYAKLNKTIKRDVLDREFPLESALVPTIIELIVKELSNTIYQPQDEENDANDNLSEIKTK